jgi:hypothetical protein
MVYQPMLELLAYLRANGFKTFIVSGGGIEFMRPWTEKVYGIPPSRSSAAAARRSSRCATASRCCQAAGDQLHRRQGRQTPGIQHHIGRRPIAAFGNSDGDLQMLQWTAAVLVARFCLYVHHTDAQREWAYDRQAQCRQTRQRTR